MQWEFPLLEVGNSNRLQYTRRLVTDAIERSTDTEAPYRLLLQQPLLNLSKDRSHETKLCTFRLSGPFSTKTMLEHVGSPRLPRYPKRSAAGSRGWRSPDPSGRHHSTLPSESRYRRTPGAIWSHAEKESLDLAFTRLL